MSIRIHSFDQLGNGSLCVLIRGNLSDADYVKTLLINETGAMIGEPKQEEGMKNFFYLLIRGVKSQPFTREKAIQVLEKDPNIEIVEGA